MALISHNERFLADHPEGYTADKTIKRYTSRKVHGHQRAFSLWAFSLLIAVLTFYEQQGSDNSHGCSADACCCV